MKTIAVLTIEQRKLVEQNTDIVKWVIIKHIIVNETVFGFSYDDLFQEGCLWLCKAASTYDGDKAKYITYAQVVVRNGLLSYCRKMCGIQKKMISTNDAPTDPSDSNSATFLENVPDSFDMDTHVASNDVIRMLESVTQEYSGVARLGIEALTLKVRGYTGAEIAQMYGVKQNHVGAWMSRAIQKLRQNESFMAELN